MIKFDFWYGDSLQDVAFVSVSFYPNEGEYRGNMKDRGGDYIGDFTATNSAEIERQFPGIFGD